MWLVCLLLTAIAAPSHQLMSCTYGARGSLTSTCVNAIPSYFRATAYRFDNLDETVQCINCTLTVIDSNTFDISGNQIQNLNLTRCQINTLKPKAFIGLVFLRRLYLQDNSITSIPSDTFQGVTKIILLNVGNNNINSLKANAFKELVNLKKLYLMNNKINTVDKDAFVGLGALEELDLSNNQITSLDNVFINLESLVSINLERNKISQIIPYGIKTMNVLLELNLGKNNIKSISKNAFLEFPRLEKLVLSVNPLDTIEMGSFRGLNSLEDLRLNNCLIPDIQNGLLLALHRLRNLDLSNNKMTVFKTGVFSGIPELRTLNLSHNSIEKYEKTGVFSLHSLHTLDMSYNNLKYLDYKLLVDHMPSLAYLELNNNPWPCYLKKEMDELFKNDNLIYSLGENTYNSDTPCDDTRPEEPIPPEEPQPIETPKTAALVTQSNGHEYVLYIFICVTLGLMAFLFYVQFRNQKEIRDFVGKSNIAEVRLLSNELEG